MKKYLFGLLAIVFAVASVAFTTKSNKTFNTKFLFTGTTTAQYTSTSPYYWTVSSDESNCDGGSLKCTVTPTSASIDLVSELVTEIAANQFSNITTNTTKP